MAVIDSIDNSEELDLSPRDAAEKAAKASMDYHAICWQNTFPDMEDNQCPFWDFQPDRIKESAARSAIITIYSYLHYRSNHDKRLEDERVLFLHEIDDRWRSVLAKTLGIPLGFLNPRGPRKYFGHDLSDPTNDLFALAREESWGAELLLEGYRREEVRRLEYKAFLLKRGPLSERESHSDELWHRKNRKTFQIAEGKIATSQEAREAAVAEIERLDREGEEG